MKRRKIIASVFAIVLVFVIALQVAVPAKAAAASLSRQKKTLYVGKSFKLKLKNSSETPSWYSTDTDIATVSQKGRVKAKRAGVCTIYALTATKSFACKITVKEKTTNSENTSKGPAGTTPFVTFSATDLNGNKIDNSTFKKNKITMINFWEYWCGPCRNELSEIQELYKNYKSQGLGVIGIFSDSIDYTQSVIDEYKLTYPMINDDSIYWSYGSGSIPFTMFVDCNGKVIESSFLVGSRSYETFESIIKPYL